MTVDETIDIFKRERAHCEEHLHFMGKSEEYYKDIQDLIDAYDVGIKILEKPKAKSFDILHFVADNAGLSTFEAIEKAYNIGVSEQELILDKMRAEIEEYKSRQLTLAIGVEDLEKGKQIALEYVLAILDKYKAESEDKE